jgi:hypothetical protein
MKKGKERKGNDLPDISRRGFLKGCGITLLTTVSYQAISILSANREVQAALCNEKCVGCITKCDTGCGATCISCTQGCEVNCTANKPS